jgi:hypothetical protein
MDGSKKKIKKIFCHLRISKTINRSGKKQKQKQNSLEGKG